MLDLAPEATRLQRVFGRELRRRREAQGLKQETLAQMAGYADHSPISQMERGKLLPSIDKAVQLAHIFGVPLDALVSDQYAPPLAEFSQEMAAIAPRDRLQMASALRALANDLERTCLP